MSANRKVVINACFGGFGLSDAALRAVAERKGLVFSSVPSGIPGVTSDRFRLKVIGPRAIATSDEYNAVFSEQRAREVREWFTGTDLPRDDADLVAVVETMADAASDECARLRVVEIPADVEWTIEEYDGSEHVAEQHRTWS